MEMREMLDGVKEQLIEKLDERSSGDGIGRSGSGVDDEQLKKLME